MLTPDGVLSIYYLDTRCKLIEIAAMLDRYDRAVANHRDANHGDANHGEANPKGIDGNDPTADARLAKVRSALQLLAQPRHAEANRSEQLLLMFSD